MFILSLSGWEKAFRLLSMGEHFLVSEPKRRELVEMGRITVLKVRLAGCEGGV